jgi:hypothetical protein
VTFGDTLLATLIGAFVGAVVGALAAWLFTLDLRRRDKEDRGQEREQSKADRESEREQDRLSRQAEREQDLALRLAERQEQQAADYDARIRQEWPGLIAAISDYANANRAIYDAVRTNTPIGGGYDRYREAATGLHQRLFEVVAVARDSDHDMANAIGLLTAYGTPHSAEHVRAMDAANDALIAYTTASPGNRATLKERLYTTLQEEVAKSRTVYEGLRSPSTDS